MRLHFLACIYSYILHWYNSVGKQQVNSKSLIRSAYASLPLKHSNRVFLLKDFTDYEEEKRSQQLNSPFAFKMLLYSLKLFEGFFPHFSCFIKVSKHFSLFVYEEKIKTRFPTKMFELNLAAEQGDICNGILVQKWFANSNISQIQVLTSSKDTQKVFQL